MIDLSNVVSLRTVWVLVVTTLLGFAAVSPSIFAQDEQPAETANQDAPAEGDPPAEGEPAAEGQQQSGQQESLPRLEDLTANFPTPEELWKNPPTDWLVLTKLEGGKEVVLETQPVIPRPDTLAKTEKAIEDFPPVSREATDKEKEKNRLQRQALFKLSIFLPNDKKEKEYFIDYRLIDRIIYHEDKLLRWVRQYGSEGKFREAFDLLFQLKRRVPDWPGVEDQHDKLIQIEAQHNLREGRMETALAMYIELYNRNPKFPGLADELGGVVNQLIDESLQQEEYRRARFYLQRLQTYFPNHPLVSQWQSRFSNAAQKTIDEALNEFTSKNFQSALQLIETAADIWPNADRLNDTHRRIADRWQQVNVGVLQFSDDHNNYPFPSEAEERIRNLVEAKLFEAQNAQEVALYGSPYLSNWVPTHLGKKLTFDLRSQFQSWEPYQPLTSFDVYDAINRRLDLNSPEADERLRSYIRDVVIKSPSRFEIIFDKVPLRPEALLSFPVKHRVPNPNSESDSNLAVSDVFIDPSRFELTDSTENTRTYTRSTPEPDNQTLYHVATVKEIKYENMESAVRGLVRGEVSMIPSVRGELAMLLRDDGRFFVQQRSLPETFVLQFNPNCEMLKNRELRRAIAYGIDRDKILAEEILHTDNPDLGRPISAPFPTQNQAYDPLSELRPYDLTLAFSLVQAAKGNLKEKFGPLKLACVPDADIRRAAQKMVDEWARIGLQIELLDENAETSVESGWDLVLRKTRMSEPIVQLWPFMTMKEEARAEDLVDLPSWLRQQLIDLETAGDLRTATRALHMLHHQLQANVEMIPLWEINDFVVLRKTITNFPPSPVYPYQAIEQWSSQAWFPQGL